MITDICHVFSKSVDSEMIRNSFKICGMDKDRFSFNYLHLPLRKLLEDEIINTEDMFLCEDNDFFLIIEHQAIEKWQNVGDDGNGFFKIISIFIYDSEDRHLIIRENVIKAFKDFEELKDLYDDQYLEKMFLNGTVVSELEIYAT
ncbi:hypothetical protein DMUE_4453 [Dictyocoela muelleri]|nr:hypothetical protein DMUE_4453 [Dictyocoela muelleri]